MSENSEPAAVKRRDFLKILGATGATGAAIGCSSDRVEKLIPYLVNPDHTVPGVSNYYASTCRECSAGCGIIAEVRDGRPIKLEGNPEHPVNRGALCASGQAALQGLYNPDRFRQPMIRRNGALQPATWDQAMQLFNQKLGEVRSGGRAGDAVFINQHESGSFPGFLDTWLAGFGMSPHLSYDALLDGAVVAANQAAYGVAWPGLDFAAARLVVSFGADFLDTWGGTVPQQLDFADARAKLEAAPRFIYVGARRSLTGLNADEWIDCKPGSELAIVQALRGGAGTSMEQAAQASGVPLARLRRLAAELTATKPSLVLAGGGGPNGGALATAVADLNRAAGNVGTTIKPTSAVSGYDRASSPAAVADAVARMAAGRVSMLMVRGANPAFTLPRTAGFAQAAAKVPFKVSFSSYPDETAMLCDLVLPDNHPLESWGDAQATPTVISLQQPMLEPVFDTRPTADVLIAAAKGNQTTAAQYPFTAYRDWLIARFPGGAAGLTAALPRGVLPGTIAAPATRTLAAAPGAAPAAPANIDAARGEFYFHVYPSLTLGDGSGANKPWLQELPDPVSKISWQTWIEMHPATAKRLDVENGEIVTLESTAGKVSAPVYLYLGIRPDTVAMPFGNGHTAYGRYAQGTGANPFDAAPAAFDPRSGAFQWTSTKVSVSKTAGYAQLVTTEGSARQHGRGIAQAVMVADLNKPASQQRDTGTRHAGEIAPTGEPGSATARPGDESARRSGEPAAHGEQLPGDASHDFLPGLRSPLAADAQGQIGTNIDRKQQGMYAPDHWSNMAARRWAMTIDLARCTGCSACITACYAENNIPTVGAAYQGRNVPGTTGAPGSNIARGREMTWIRLERYFEGGENPSDITDFEARFVPMLCQHCGNAPCEPVCPVYATYHSPDGLNVQVYNRCVGTRYCSNNCPYKVRYFNWFGYGEPDRPQYAWPEPLHLALNPDVTVRGKGVMEKCSFCVQRIREAEHRAKLEGRPVKPDEFTVACAQACPSRAITFGDAADQNWTVAQQVADHRAYHVFEELNTFTAVVYLKKVNHPAPAAPAGA